METQTFLNHGIYTLMCVYYDKYIILCVYTIKE